MEGLQLTLEIAYDFVSSDLALIQQLNRAVHQIAFTTVCERNPPVVIHVTLQGDYVTVMKYAGYYRDSIDPAIRIENLDGTGYGQSIGRSEFWNAVTEMQKEHLSDFSLLHALFFGTRQIQAWSSVRGTGTVMELTRLLRFIQQFYSSRY